MVKLDFSLEVEVDENFICVVGMKASCGECGKKITPTKHQQETLFNRRPLACPSCDCLLTSSQEQLDELRAKGNPGQRYIPTMIIMGICNMVFFGMVLAGLINQEAVILLGFFIAIGGHLVLSICFKSATRDLEVQLEKCDSP
ncbi:hypothetical protein ACTUVN_005039 [Pseudomonas caspiana]